MHSLKNKIRRPSRGLGQKQPQNTPWKPHFEGFDIVIVGFLTSSENTTQYKVISLGSSNYLEQWSDIILGLDTFSDPETRCNFSVFKGSVGGDTGTTKITYASSIRLSTILSDRPYVFHHGLLNLYGALSSLWLSASSMALCPVSSLPLIYRSLCPLYGFLSPLRPSVPFTGHLFSSLFCEMIMSCSCFTKHISPQRAISRNRKKEPLLLFREIAKCILRNVS
jgi:hypothetical protein